MIFSPKKARARPMVSPRTFHLDAEQNQHAQQAKQQLEAISNEGMGLLRDDEMIFLQEQNWGKVRRSSLRTTTEDVTSHSGRRHPPTARKVRKSSHACEFNYRLASERSMQPEEQDEQATTKQPEMMVARQMRMSFGDSFLPKTKENFVCRFITEIEEERKKKLQKLQKTGSTKRTMSFTEKYKNIQGLKKIKTHSSLRKYSVSTSHTTHQHYSISKCQSSSNSSRIKKSDIKKITEVQNSLKTSNLSNSRMRAEIDEPPKVQLRPQFFRLISKIKQAEEDKLKKLAEFTSGNKIECRGRAI